MNSNAAGQLAGYALQFPRALYHLLTCGPGDAVCVEVIGDVGTLYRNEDILSEEDKSAFDRNPVTDKSKDLWKTFYNWMQMLIHKKCSVEKVRFLLYVNHSGRPSIAQKFSDAKDVEAAEKAIEFAKEKLSDIKIDHKIWKYYKYAIIEQPDMLRDIILRFELCVGSRTSSGEVRTEIMKKCIPESFIDIIEEHLLGWLLKIIPERIYKGLSPIISWEEFNRKFVCLFHDARRDALFDFTFGKCSTEDIYRQVKLRPTYLMQLEAINYSDDDMIKAVSDYLRANVNRQEWIRNGSMNEADADEFESKLRRIWELAKTQIEIRDRDLDGADRGRLLASKCLAKQVPIGNENPPDSTVAGSYHSLTDQPAIGWHPDWEKLFKT